MLLLMMAALAGPAADVQAIRRERARSNAAIAAHRYDDMRPIQLPDYALLPGSLGKPLQGEEIGRRISTGFSDPTFVTYVRTPGRIVIASNRKRAAETGTWVGLWRKPDGEMRLSGIYQAMWVPADGGWRLQNESFVTLRCTGSRACSSVD